MEGDGGGQRETLAAGEAEHLRTRQEVVGGGKRGGGWHQAQQREAKEAEVLFHQVLSGLVAFQSQI